MIYSTLVPLLLILVGSLTAASLFQSQKRTQQDQTVRKHAESLIQTQIVRRMNPVSLDVILDKFNAELPSQNCGLVTRRFKYTKTNLDPMLLDQSKSIIHSILRVINRHSFGRFTFVDVEAIIDSISEGQHCIQVVFFVHEAVRHYTAKLQLDYCMTDNSQSVQIQSLRLLSSKDELLSLPQLDFSQTSILQSDLRTNWDQVITGGDWDSSKHVHPFYYQWDEDGVPPWVIRPAKLVSNLQTLEKVCYTQEPCKYDIDRWDTHGVNEQVKLGKTCSVINHSDHIENPDPYVNPTMFDIDP